MGKYTNLVERLEKMPLDQRLSSADRIDQMIKECVSNNVRIGSVDYSSISRFLCQYAMSISDEKRNNDLSSSNYNSPRWKDIKDGIDNFSNSSTEEIKNILCKSIKPTYIAQFATLASRKRGARITRLYFTIILYVCYLQEQGAFETEFMQLTLTSEERRVPARLIAAIEAHIDGSGVSADTSNATLGMYVSFEVAQSDMEKLSGFVDRFVFGSDLCAHLVLYRPMRRDPKSIMKSFLSISPPERHRQDKYTHQFTNIYHPPGGQGNSRIGSGKILPLNNAVYFVGGQKPAIDRPSRNEIRTPFTSMKILAFRWLDFEQRHTLIPGVVMTADYEGLSVISRIVARLTPIKHSRDLSLGDVKIVNLADDLRNDMEAEEKAIMLVENSKDGLKDKWRPENAQAFNVEKSDEQIDEISRRIIEQCNNNPIQSNGWRVSDGFSRDITSRRSETLNDHRLMGHIQEALESKGSKYLDENGKEFEIWEDLRFGPITI